jgi:hypothetical protein
MQQLRRAERLGFEAQPNLRFTSKPVRNQLLQATSRIAALRVSGTFRTGEVEDFLDALTKVHPLTIHRPSADEARLVWQE